MKIMKIKYLKNYMYTIRYQISLINLFLDTILLIFNVRHPIMEFPVEKSEFLKMYTDKKSTDQENTSLENTNPSDCKICTNELTKEELLSMVIKCTNFAALKHSKQRRKNKEQTPYINHPIGNK